MTDTAVTRQVAIEYLHAVIDRDIDAAVVAFTLLDSVVFEGDATQNEAAHITAALGHFAAVLACVAADTFDLDPHKLLDRIAKYNGPGQMG